MSRKASRATASNLRRKLNRVQPSRTSRRPATPGRARIQIGRPPRQRTVNPILNRQRARKQRTKARAVQQAGRIRPAVRPVASPRPVMPQQRKPSRSGAANRSAVPTRRIVPTRSAPRARSVVRPRGRPATGTVPPPASRIPPAMATLAAAGTAAAGTAFLLRREQAHPEVSLDVSSLQASLDQLGQLSDFEDVSVDMDQVESELARVMDLLEGARDKGFLYEADLDALALRAAQKWEEAEVDIRNQIPLKEDAFRARLSPLNRQIDQLNAHLGHAAQARSHIQRVESAVNGLLSEVQRDRRSLQDQYSEVESALHALRARLQVIHWMLAQLEEARFRLESDEGLVRGVKARWDKEGKEDPEGILFLTDQRLIFERKEKVATKKVLFVTTSSEMVQEVIFEAPGPEISAVKAVSKGLFGHQDFLEIKAPQGNIHFHLDGQDSKEWARLVDLVRSGRIQDQRASRSALSFADVTGAVTQADILAAQDEVNQIQDELMLQDARADLEELENEVRSLERKLGDVRAKGYAIEGDLEAELSILAAQWDRIKASSTSVLDQQAALLAQQSRSLQDQMARLAGLGDSQSAARSGYMQLKSALASAEAQAEAAEATVFAQYEDYADEVEGLSAHLDWVDWMLDALSTASFQLLATESGVAAAEAMWLPAGREGENGVLFLTDQRLLWEDRVGEHELRIEQPISTIQNIQLESGEDEDHILNFSFKGGAAIPEARFDLADLVGQDWLTMVGRARNGDYSRDRAIEIDPVELERARNAPTSCPNCSASLTAPVLRGQTEITCEWCGAVTRL